MAEAPVEPTPAPAFPKKGRAPEPIAAITSLGIFGSLAILVGVILMIVTFSIGDSTDPTVGDLSARFVSASIASVALTAGFIASIAVGVLAGIREMLRRNRSGQPL